MANRICLKVLLWLACACALAAVPERPRFGLSVFGSSIADENFSSLALTSPPPAASTIVGSQSRWLTISLDTVPGLITPGQRTMQGTR